MAEGDLGAIIDSLEFDPARGVYPRIIPIAGNVYAIVYSDVDSDGFLITVTIADDGTIGSIIDTYEFDASFCQTPFIFHISGTTYAIAYQSVSGGQGSLVTVTIADNGTITKSIIDSLVFDTVVLWPRIIHVSGDVYAIIYQGTDNDGYVCTVTIEANGQIGDSVIDSLEYNTTAGQAPDILHHTGDIFIFAFLEVSPNGYIETYSIDAAGNISARIDRGLFTVGSDPVLIRISGNVYACVYSGLGTDGYVLTFSVDASGNIFYIDTWEYDEIFGRGPDILHVSGGSYLVAYYHYEGAPLFLTTGYLFSFRIANDGTIIPSMIDTLVYDSGGGAAYAPVLIHIAHSIYAVCYMGIDYHGWLRTFDCETLEIRPGLSPAMMELLVGA